MGQPGYLRNFIKRQKVRPECKSTFFPLMTKWHKDRSPPSLLPDLSNKIILHWGLISSIRSFAFEPSCNKTGKYGVTTAGSRPGAKKTRRKRRGRRWILIPIQGQRGQHKYNTDTLGNTKEWHNTNTGSDGSIPRQRQKTCRPSFFPSTSGNSRCHCNDEDHKKYEYWTI